MRLRLDELMALDFYGVPVWVIAALSVTAILLTIAGLAYVVITQKPSD